MFDILSLRPALFGELFPDELQHLAKAGGWRAADLMAGVAASKRIARGDFPPNNMPAGSGSNDIDPLD